MQRFEVVSELRRMLWAKQVSHLEFVSRIYEEVFVNTAHPCTAFKRSSQSRVDSLADWLCPTVGILTDAPCRCQYVA